jgi:hypothetical protein
LAGLLLALSAWPATTPPAAAQPAGAWVAPCTAPADLAPAQLYGRWEFRLQPQSDQPGTETAAVKGSIRFERHPEFPDSVRGSLQHAGKGQAVHALVSGDVINGEFNLDESTDGQRIDAVWTGNVSPAGCGKEIRGVRLPAHDQPGEPMNFVLMKAPGWE